MWVGNACGLLYTSSKTSKLLFLALYCYTLLGNMPADTLQYTIWVYIVYMGYMYLLSWNDCTLHCIYYSLLFCMAIMEDPVGAGSPSRQHKQLSQQVHTTDECTNSYANATYAIGSVRGQWHVYPGWWLCHSIAAGHACYVHINRNFQQGKWNENQKAWRN